jgi:hypothetical protein
METAKANNPQRRKRLAEFMVVLSKCESICPSTRCISAQIHAALCELMKVPNRIAEPVIFGNGMNWALGDNYLPIEFRLTYPYISRLIESFVNQADIVADILSSPEFLNRKLAIQELRDHERRMANMQQ